jgi:SAM-dependent methyltransferase
MNDHDKQVIIDRYHKRLDELGPTAAALGEPKGRQGYYFHFLLGAPEFASCASLLDVGCGYGDLYQHLRLRGWQGRYVGVDIVPGLIEEGRRRYPEADLRLEDIQLSPPAERFDWVVSVHALTGATQHVDYYAHLEGMLRAMWSACDVGMSFNLFSPFADFQHPLHFHPDIGRATAIVSTLSRRFVLRHDYMPFEYAYYVYKDAAIEKSMSVFSCHREHLSVLAGP